MTYHEIGERFKFYRCVLEVVEVVDRSNVDKCKKCFFSWNCKLPFTMNCREDIRKDGKSIYYKIVGKYEPKDMEQENKTEARKNDRLDDKLRWELLPLEDVEDIVRVYTAGAKKYGPDQWQNLPDGIRRYKAALLRHLVEFDKGNEIDEETGCRHLAAVAWNAIAMLHISKYNNNESSN